MSNLYEIFLHTLHRIFPNTRQGNEGPAEDKPLFQEKFKRPVVALIVILQMLAVASFALSLWCNGQGDKLVMICATSILCIYAGVFYLLYHSHISSQTSARILVLIVISLFFLLLNCYPQKVNHTSSRGGVFLLAPFSYVFAGRKFGILITALTCFITAFAQYDSTAWIEMIFNVIIDLTIRILMFAILAALSNERDFVDSSRDDKIKRASEDSEARSAFLRMISHELRTPIHGIIATTEILRSSELSSSQKALLSTIQCAGASMGHMADYIVRVANTDDLANMGKVTRRSENFDLYKTAAEISDAVALLFEVKGIEYEFDYNVPLEMFLLVGDIGLLKQILINLMGNILSVTRSGVVHFVINSKEIRNPAKDTEPHESVFEITFEISSRGEIVTTGEGEFDLENDIIFTEKLTRSFGGTFELKTEPFEEDRRLESLAFKISFNLPLSQEAQNVVEETPIPHRYITEEIEPVVKVSDVVRAVIIPKTENGELSPIMKRVEKYLQNDLGIAPVVIKGPKDLNYKFNVGIVDGADDPSPYLVDIFKQFVAYDIVPCIICKPRKHQDVSGILDQIGFKRHEVQFMFKPVTHVKLWNLLIAATNTLLKSQGVSEKAKTKQPGPPYNV